VRVFTKICGITRIEDAELAAGEGADYLGLNFWPGSKRRVSPELAQVLAAAARAAAPSVQLVGLFVDPSDGEVAAIAAALDLDVVQLHGDEPPAMVAPRDSVCFISVRFLGRGTRRQPEDDQRTRAPPHGTNDH
jgi:phosphoribosylanthranilate isomerase